MPARVFREGFCMLFVGGLASSVVVRGLRDEFSLIIGGNG